MAVSEVRMAEGPTDGGATAPGSLRDLITERTLRLVDRQIGRGEPPSPEEWQELRGMARGNEDTLRQLDELESIVRRFDEQLRARFGAGEGTVDLSQLRQGLAHLIREIVRGKNPSAPSVH